MLIQHISRFYGTLPTFMNIAFCLHSLHHLSECYTQGMRILPLLWSGTCCTVNHTGTLQDQAAMNMFRICQDHCEEANWECETSNFKRCVVAILTDNYTITISHHSIEFHDSNSNDQEDILTCPVAPSRARVEKSRGVNMPLASWDLPQWCKHY